ncbi:hypothetical protein K466DRAFT_368301 [Polyporus arcularius HHB13444]|uniref:Uncharacterized protein n=1 Tax=Polyporus arcularius HHB13444 TaxID=1314778 RepID=A0A5C3NU06_9APHY|nr:hypothetical protein K466DRAFT_368301 [Polyporus arcularius HHB13444]
MRWDAQRMSVPAANLRLAEQACSGRAHEARSLAQMASPDWREVTNATAWESPRTLSSQTRYPDPACQTL